MKAINIFIGAALFLFASCSAGQKADTSVVTTEFKVEGVCDMCKKRIEEAAYTKGVKFAEWDLKSGILKVVYKPEVISEMEIHQNIANAGHTTEKVKAYEAAYEALPQCCKYDDGVEKH